MCAQHELAEMSAPIALMIANMKFCHFFHVSDVITYTSFLDYLLMVY